MRYCCKKIHVCVNLAYWTHCICISIPLVPSAAVVNEKSVREPRKLLFLSSKNMFLGSKYPKKYVFNFWKQTYCLCLDQDWVIQSTCIISCFVAQHPETFRWCASKTASACTLRTTADTSYGWNRKKHVFILWTVHVKIQVPNTV